MKIYRAAQVAQKLGISKQTLLRYEKKGIFQQSRRNHINSWREYTDDDIRRMKIVLNRGYTVMEVVMLIVIVGIMAALVVPRFDSFYSIKLSGAAKKMMSDIRYAQQIAISSHTNTAVVFNRAADVYSVKEESPQGSNNWPYVKDSYTRANLIMDYRSDPQYRGIDISSTSFANDTLQFNWTGAPLAGGSITLALRDNSNAVFVENGTGKVRGQ